MSPALSVPPVDCDVFIPEHPSWESACASAELDVCGHATAGERLSVTGISRGSLKMLALKASPASATIGDYTEAKAAAQTTPVRVFPKETGRAGVEPPICR